MSKELHKIKEEPDDMSGKAQDSPKPKERWAKGSKKGTEHIRGRKKGNYAVTCRALVTNGGYIHRNAIELCKTGRILNIRQEDLGMLLQVAHKGLT